MIESGATKGQLSERDESRTSLWSSMLFLVTGTLIYRHLVDLE